VPKPTPPLNLIALTSNNNDWLGSPDLDLESAVFALLSGTEQQHH